MAAAGSHDGGFTYSSILGLFSDFEFYVAAGKVNVFFKIVAFGRILAD